MDLLKTTIGIELGSTRIKAIMLDEKFNIIAQGIYDWENKLINGIWTYSIDLAIKGLQECYRNLAFNFKEKYNMPLDKTGAIGISGMMHGYLVFDSDDNQIAEFRTWRNTITGEASKILTDKFGFHIPQRWSIAHIYQAILNKEKDVEKISFATTLAGYIHYLLTSNKVIGIGEASGMFPIDSRILDYNEKMLDIYDELVNDNVSYKIKDILPKVLTCGSNAGYLTKEGALLLDPTGILQPGIPFCPPEGDMQTGMVATNSVKEYTGNASLGTSSNVTIITNKDINIYEQIDVITTPEGINAALVHVNNGTSDINAWVNLFYDVVKLVGCDVDKNTLFTKLFESSLEGNKNIDGMLAYNYFSGEPICNINEGRPLVIRNPEYPMDIKSFMRMNIYSVLTTIRMGMDILTNEEGIKIDKLYGHGGFFKTPNVGQLMLSSALNTKVLTLSSADLGGPYGMALLAAYYLFNKKERLADFLDNNVFSNIKSNEAMANNCQIDEFNKYYERFKKSLNIEKCAIKEFR